MRLYDNISMIKAKGVGNWTTFVVGSSSIISINDGGLFMWRDGAWCNLSPFDIGKNGKLKIIGVDEG